MLSAVRHRRVRWFAWLAALALLLAAEASLRGAWLTAMEAPWSDLWFRLEGASASVDHVAIVELDEATLANYPDDPLVFWTPQFARACRVLDAAGVRVIGLDIQFGISPERWLAKISGRSSPAARKYDQEFRAVLASGKVVVAGRQTGPEASLPTADYLAVLPDFDVRRYVGSADLLSDTDGTLRRMAVQAPGAVQAPADGVKLLTLPVLLAIHATGQRADAAQWMFAGRRIAVDTAPWPLAFSGPPSTVPRVSLRTVLAPDALEKPEIQALRGKVVILGPGYGGVNDVHLTPYGHGLFSARLMSGPEIHAQALESLLDGRVLQPVPDGVRLALALALVAGMTVFWLRQPVMAGTLGWLLVVVCLSGLAFLAHREGWSMPLAHWQAVLLLQFMVVYGLRFTFGERERSWVRTLFSRYQSHDVAASLIEADTLPQLGGREADITVLFSDLRGFTTLSEQMTPAEVVAMLNQWFEQACQAILAEGGRIDKFIGDAVMAEFGVPNAQPDHARRALRAALRLAEVAAGMQAWMEERFRGRNLPPFAIGVGLHTGPAVVGNIGSNERMEYTAIGDTVNLASRLEGVTRQFDCVVVASRATLTAAGPGVSVGRCETLKVKGRDEAVEVFEIKKLEEV